MRHQQRPPVLKRLRGPEAFFLIWALLVVALVSSFMMTGLTRSHIELAGSQRFINNEQAFQLAEAGLNDALALLRTSSLQWTDELSNPGPDQTPGTPDDGQLSLTPLGPGVSGSYTVSVIDNNDEAPLAANDPRRDVDGLVKISSTGTMLDSQRTVSSWVSATFSYALAAQQYIELRQSTSTLGNMHSNGDLIVDQTSALEGCSRATATGSIVGGAGFSYSSCGGKQSGVPPVIFPQPDAAALLNAVIANPDPFRWDPPDYRHTIVLNTPNAVYGYARQLYDPSPGGAQNSPETVVVNLADTIVMFPNNSIRFKKPINADTNGNCLGPPMKLNVIAVGGSILFDQPVCLQGLIWAEGSVTIAQDSKIFGAIVSAGSFIDVRQRSRIVFDPNVLDAGLLPGFRGLSVLSWQEE